jgi:hypothetical protein
MDELYNKDEFMEREPLLETFIEIESVPKEDKFWEFIFPFLKTKRLEKKKKLKKSIMMPFFNINMQKINF